MSDKNKKYFDNLISKTKIYLGIILILLIYVVVEHPTFLIPSILVYIIICAYTYYANKKRKNEISETLQDLTITVDSAAKTSMINSPLPLVILESDGRIIWKSAKFITEFSNVDILSYIDDLNIDITGEIQNKKEIKNR